MAMKVKKLQEQLESLYTFEEPSIELEQYHTPPHIAAHFLHEIYFDGNMKDCLIADLGSGCGCLTIGACLMGCRLCIGFEVDPSANALAKENQSMTDLSNMEFVQLDLNYESTVLRWKGMFDTVILNPPFGTKGSRGVDMQFLKLAIDLSSNVVYSFHKSTTKEHIYRKGKQWDVLVQEMANVRFNLDQSYSKHRQKQKDIEVSCFKFQKSVKKNQQT